MPKPKSRSPVVEVSEDLSELSAFIELPTNDDMGTTEATQWRDNDDGPSPKTPFKVSYIWKFLKVPLNSKIILCCRILAVNHVVIPTNQVLNGKDQSWQLIQIITKMWLQ